MSYAITTIDDLPDELLIAIFRFVGDRKSSLLPVCHRWRDLAWELTIHPFDRGRRPLAKMRPASVTALPFDFYTTFDLEFAMPKLRIENCPGCKNDPLQCACVCDCKESAHALRTCDRRAHWDLWRFDDVFVCDEDERRYCLHEAMTASQSSLYRIPALRNWESLNRATDAASYLGRCAQFLIDQGIFANERDICRMSCSAIVRRAHQLADYNLRVDHEWRGDCVPCDACSRWSYRESRCECCGHKLEYFSDSVETDPRFSLDSERPNGVPIAA